MILPHFTIRWLLLLTACSSVFFLVVSHAVQGKIWAISLSAAVASVAVAFLMYAAFFGLAFVLASVQNSFSQRRIGGTPFATAEPPPQILPPQNPDTF